MKKEFNAALVLEGGSLRCLFTAGVLDVFMEQGIWLPYVIGVSAGSLSGINYVSGQIGRTAKINLDYIEDKRYLGIRNLLTGKGIFNFDFLFGEITEQLIPLDKETFYHSPTRYLAVATCCEDGTPRYFEKDHCSDIMLAARASSSMPLLARMVELNGEHLLDGGISMPKRYNQMQKEIDLLEKKGELFVIRPEFPVTISRIEKDRTKLNALYEEGRKVAEKQLVALNRFLEQRPSSLEKKLASSL